MKFSLQNINRDCCAITGTIEALASLAAKGKIEVLSKGDDQFDDSGVRVWLDLPHHQVIDPANWKGNEYVPQALHVECEASSASEAVTETIAALAGEPNMAMPYPGASVQILVLFSAIAKLAEDAANWKSEDAIPPLEAS